ncbi:S-adenosylmethionine sensor upstream of mTORC1 [Halyomorpha halys]|uniref:S-adenosylmethionine sensor upstream of mTORC1 n=1 Tax=Halyomorpha halys TaxID=286706 RepID=UPI0006D502B3|nr:S-adenosylmethionine sensor upstream of mTORC1 [Halyomorpha halys]
MGKHQDLADFIKGVHINLRLRSREIGAEAAWEEHCKDRQTLEKYASAMRELATVHWEKNSRINSDQSGILWVFEKCNWYFFGEGKDLFISKETKMASRYSVTCDFNEYFVGKSISLLDVGSCYNPLSQFPNLITTAIDLEPADKNVLRCDFLSVDVADQLLVIDNSCTQLPKESYDVILFSLLLEYLPSPRQRFVACKKAAKLLKKGGLLLILTPDSKHATANSRLARQWRLALASLGMWMLTTEKLKHLRCFTFVKAHDKRLIENWLALQEVNMPADEAIAIPQDKNPYEDFNSRETEHSRSDTDNNYLANTFSQIIGDEDIFLE